MSDNATIIAIALGFLAVALAVLGLFRSRSASSLQSLTREQAAELFRSEHDRLRGTLEEQVRGVRTELGEPMRGVQESGVRNFAELGKALEAQTTGIGDRMETGVTRIEKQVGTIGEKLDAELQKLATEETENRDKLRKAIEERCNVSPSCVCTTSPSRWSCCSRRGRTRKVTSAPPLMMIGSPRVLVQA